MEVHTELANDLSQLPEGWELKKLNEVCLINPPKSEVRDKMALEVSFVPMADLQEKCISFEPKQVKNVKDVYSGYTYFRDEDVLLAKVTPCFENGKSGIARNLVNGIGFGSSEYYVLRPLKGVLPEYIYHIIASEKFLKEGKENMSGAVGLQRVTKSFLESYPVPIPPIAIQQEIINQLSCLFIRIDKSVQLIKENLEHLKHLLPAALNEVFEGAEDHCWKYYNVFDVLSLEKRTITPALEKKYNIVGLENIERDTGRLIDFTPMLGKQSTSTKVIFEKGMILYGKLRPYLNKVWVSEFDGISTSEILPFKANENLVAPHYVAYYFRSPGFLNKVEGNCSGARMPRLTTKFWDEAQIPIPSISVQERIVNYLNQLSTYKMELQQQYEQKLSHLQTLKKSILDAAFKGELTLSKQSAEALEV